MGDWERTFGERGMLDGGMRIIEDIVDTEKSSRDVDDDDSYYDREDRRDKTFDKEFDSWEEAHHCASSGPGWTIRQSPNGGYVCCFNGYSENERAKRRIDAGEAALNLIDDWSVHSSGALLRRHFSAEDPKYGHATTLYRGRRFLYDSSAMVFSVRLFDQKVGEIPLSSYLDDPQSFQAVVDEFLDSVGAPPLAYVRPEGPLRLPPLDGFIAITAVGTWPGSSLHDVEFRTFRYRSLVFRYDNVTQAICVRNSTKEDVASISLSTFKECYLRQQSFRAHVDEILDQLGAPAAADQASPNDEWIRHPVREALITIAGEDSAWAVTPPGSLYGYAIRIFPTSLDVWKDADEWISFSIPEIKACGTLDNLLYEIRQWICWREDEFRPNGLLEERLSFTQRKFTKPQYPGRPKKGVPMFCKLRVKRSIQAAESYKGVNVKPGTYYASYTGNELFLYEALLDGNGLGVSISDNPELSGFPESLGPSAPIELI